MHALDPDLCLLTLMLQAAQQLPLPAGWAEHTDPASGRTFYASTAGQSQWERPTAAAAAAAPSPSHQVCARCSAPCCRLTRSLQAAAAARIAGKPDVLEAAGRGDTALVRDHIAADASCVNKRHFECDPYPFTHAL